MLSNIISTLLEKITTLKIPRPVATKTLDVETYSSKNIQNLIAKEAIEQ